MTCRSFMIYVSMIGAATPALVAAQSEAPSYKWIVADPGEAGRSLTTKVSYAPGSIKVAGKTVTVWMLTEHYRAADNYREKYYGEFSINCVTGDAREVASVIDRFGRGKPPRFGRMKPGFNDYDDVLAPNSLGERAVLRRIAQKSCPK